MSHDIKRPLSIDAMAVVVVLYHPDPGQVDVITRTIEQGYGKVCVIDNSPVVHKTLQNLADPNFAYFHFSDNIGLSKAYNVALEHAKVAGFEWLLLLDQDSELALPTMQALCEQANNQDLTDVAILNLNAHADPDSAPLPKEEYVYRYEAISSGSVLNVKKALEVGGFCEKLFIDTIDCEFSFRCVLQGYKILRFNRLFIKHSIGYPRSTPLKLFGKHLLSYNHAPLRRYYMVRNNLELWWRYRRCGHKDIVRLMRFSVFVWVFGQMTAVLFEKQKIKKWYYSLKGAFHFAVRRFGK